MMKRMFVAPPRETTADRILTASLKLFNEEGFHSVPANRIAKYLGMSAGHLAYHFKSKSDILAALFPRLEDSLAEIIHLEVADTAPQSIDRSLHILQVLWEYRFFFVELPQLIALDRRAFDFYLMLESHVIELIRRSFDERIAERKMRRIAAPNSTAMLAKNIWILWQDWVRHESLNRPAQPMPSSESVYDAMLRAYCIAQPFLPPSFFSAAQEELKARLKPASESPRKTAAAKSARRKPAQP